MTDAPTPRTDAEEFDSTEYDSIGRAIKLKVVQSHKARELERELTALRAELTAAALENDVLENLCGERFDEIDILRGELEQEQKAHKQTSRHGNATADGLYAELDKERKAGGGGV